jgi:hypothetical protein
MPDRKGEQPLEVVTKACKDTRNLYAWRTLIKSMQDTIENKKMGRVMHSMALLQVARACVHADFLALVHACVCVRAHGASRRRTDP